MLEIVFVADYRPEGQHVPVDSLNALMEESYEPFLRICEQESWSVLHAWNGFTLRQLGKNHTNFLAKLHYLIKLQKAELASKGFSDAMLGILGKVDIQRQLSAAHEIEIQTWSKPSPGFYSVEGFIDPWVVGALQNTGIEWAIINSKHFSYCPPEYRYQIVHVQGYHKDSFLPCLVIWDDATIYDGFLQVLLGKADPKQLIADIVNVVSKKEHPIFLLPFPMELPLFSQKEEAILQRFRVFMQFLSNAIPCRIQSANALIEEAKQSGKKRFIYYNSSIYEKRLQILFQDITSLCLLAQQKNAQSNFLQAAQENLMLAQDHEALRIFQSPLPSTPENIFLNVFSRYTHACLRLEHAYQQLETVLRPETTKIIATKPR